ncbi:MAG: hypothetical protein H0Z37_07875 [Firmicutes bacterium]|nr:hypothetical protein [Bacillota bacterium]
MTVRRFIAFIRYVLAALFGLSALGMLIDGQYPAFAVVALLALLIVPRRAKRQHAGPRVSEPEPNAGKASPSRPPTGFVHADRSSAQAREGETGVAAVMDVETTGLDPRRDEIIELAIVLFSFHRGTGKVLEVAEEYTGLQEPNRPIPEFLTNLHGLSNEDVKGRALDDHAVAALIARADFIIAHNAEFDKAFVTRRYPLAASKPWRCSLKEINWRAHGFRSGRLSYLLLCHNISRQQHRALDDARATLELLNLPTKHGHTYLKELLDGRTHRTTPSSTALEDMTLEDLLNVPGLHGAAICREALEGKRVVLSGRFQRWTRAEAQRLLELLGARCTSSVSRRTDFVVAGDGFGNKVKKARELGIPVLNEDEFVSMLVGSPRTDQSTAS